MTPFAVLPMLIALTYAAASAHAAPLVVTPLPDATVFSRTYTSTGDSSTVNGNVSAGDVATVGAGARVTGNLSSVNASNTGASATVGANIRSGGVTTAGAGATVVGNTTSSGAATLGAHAKLGGNLIAGGATTTGASANVQGFIQSGGTATVGANSVVVGPVAAVGLITVAPSANLGSQTPLLSSPINPIAWTMSLDADNVADALLVSNTRSYLTALGAGTELATTMPVDRMLLAGVYSAANFSTTAGTHLILDGQGLDDQSWVFNIANYLVTGANTTVTMANAGMRNSILWNVGGYTSLGADAFFLGTVLAQTYIAVGANTVVSGPDFSCGRVFSATSYVSVGAGAVVGGDGCEAAPNISAVPEPESLWLVLAGMAGMVMAMLASRRRRICGAGHEPPGAAVAA
jgi:predicted acyltransferase (DUF342 family)